jgi:hypothetical protein
MAKLCRAFALALVLTSALACTSNNGNNAVVSNAVVEREPGQQEEPKKLQEKAEAAQWKWSDYENNLLHCALHNLTGYEVRITRPKGAEMEWEPFRVSILDGNAEVYAFRGHSETVFTQLGDVIYVAELRPIRTGCSVVAFDLKARRELWKCHLNGNPPNAHSMYRHQVNITHEDGVVVVYGKESNGRYIEYVDARSGKIVGHKKLPPEP